MPIITLTSDWNNNDFYVAALKGKILSNCPNVTIIDISHQVQAFSVSQAAFVVKNSYRNFPKRSVHIIAVNTEPGKDQPHVVVKSDNHFFIGCDNGIFGLLFDTLPQEVVKIVNKSADQERFTAFNVFSRVDCQLIRGNKLLEIGEKYDNLNRKVPILPTIDDSVMTGSVLYIDSFKNAITNISEAAFNNLKKNRRFDIYIQSNHYKVSKINKTYRETSVGELLVLFNSVGFLEIAINNGNAADLLNLSVGAQVRIKFYD